MKLVELARTVRSKNAGPLKLTLDLLFDDQSAYHRALHLFGGNGRTGTTASTNCAVVAYRSSMQR